MTFEERRAALIRDLLGKAVIADWHGVSDAANDLRVLEARNGTSAGNDPQVRELLGELFGRRTQDSTR